jgi:molybdenum cofactor biosynthesis protein A
LASYLCSVLQDSHGRTISYLRLGVTDRCNLRCRYCMPAGGINFSHKSELLTFEEILFLGKVLRKMGVVKVRLTGGEPLVRRGLPELVHELGQIFPTLAMTTNGVLLPPMLDTLIESGLKRYNLSLDTLRPDRFSAITRRDDFTGTMAALDALLERGVTTKINVVVLKGTNDDELVDFVALTKGNNLDVRFIEAMPFNDDDGNHHLFLPYHEMLERLRAVYPDLEQIEGEKNSSSITYQVPGFRGNVGLIPAYSRSLCGSCNRLRLTPKGTMLNCLYSTKGLELRPLLRGGISETDLEQLITNFVATKEIDGFVTERKEQVGGVFASMTSIGG